MLPTRPRLAHHYAREFMPNSETPAAETAPASAECLNPSPHGLELATEPPVEEQDGTASPEELVRQVINLRHQQGMTQAAFAEELGVPKATLKDWEQGRRLPTSTSCTLLKRHLGLS